MKVNFKFDGVYKDNKWKYSYESDSDKIIINSIRTDKDSVHIDVDLDIKDESSIKEDTYINECSILASNNPNLKEVSNIFKRINLREIDYSKADSRGNINLYKFNVHTNPAYIRFGNADKPDTFSYEEIEDLKSKYTDNNGLYIPTKLIGREAYNYQCIIAVDLIRSNVFKEHEVYLLYVVTRTMYEMITGREMLRLGMDEGQKYIANFLTRERLDSCLVK